MCVNYSHRFEVAPNYHLGAKSNIAYTEKDDLQEWRRGLNERTYNYSSLLHVAEAPINKYRFPRESGLNGGLWSLPIPCDLNFVPIAVPCTPRPWWGLGCGGSHRTRGVCHSRGLPELEGARGAILWASDGGFGFAQAVQKGYSISTKRSQPSVSIRC